MPSKERHKELSRRRARKKKVQKLKLQAATANASEKEEIIAKLRRLTPGANVLIKNWGLDS
ncbi:MAG: hypothetical protein NXI22_08180 [bacterium]|nr:hypothetical protein [bacterium]